MWRDLRQDYALYVFTMKLKISDRPESPDELFQDAYEES